jgi:glycosyltransferase involved in cell wall biosynthesis
MRVAFCIRPEYNKPLGGDAIQMLRTKKYLEKNYDILIDILTEPKEITNVYNIVHVFNFSTYKISRKFIEKAVECGIPIVSSSIYWDYSYASTTKLFYLFPWLNYLEESTLNIFRKIILLIGSVYSKPDVVSSVFKRNARWMYERSNVVAPNSIEEAELLLRWIKVNDLDKIRVVYNATDCKISQTKTDEDTFHKRYNIPKDYILQVGRIEYCKNQLNLVASLKNNPEIPIVFVGKIVDRFYYKKILQIAKKRGNVYFVDAVEHSEISLFFKFAKLHVLLSLRESPGLVNIEALSNECPIVISDERFLPVKTYFPNQPYVVNPLNIEEIKEVVLKAYREKEIAPFDFEKFSWNTVSNQTYNIYNDILSK